MVVASRRLAFEDAGLPAEQIDLVLALAAVLPREQPARRNADRVEAERVGSHR